MSLPWSSASHAAIRDIAADLCPPDIQEYGIRHGIPEFAKATWRAGFVDGCRYMRAVDPDRNPSAVDVLMAQLADAKATLERAAKLLARDYPSVANNLVNQCAIRCGDVLLSAKG